MKESMRGIAVFAAISLCAFMAFYAIFSTMFGCGTAAIEIEQLLEKCGSRGNVQRIAYEPGKAHVFCKDGTKYSIDRY